MAGEYSRPPANYREMRSRSKIGPLGVQYTPFDSESQRPQKPRLDGGFRGR
jgi:hypothetical protein